MSHNAMTRRSFLAGSAGAIALGGLAGFMGYGAWEKAQADEAADGGGGEKRCTLCDGCGNQCGMNVWVGSDGRVMRAMGMPGHPCTGGKLCGRGQGLLAMAYSADRITAPLKKNDKGTFEEITWDQAFSEIAEAFGNSPEKLAAIQSRGTSSFFVKRFLTAMGSPNYYTDAAFNDCDITAAIEGVSGAYPSPDVEHAKYAVMLDKSSYDGFRPAEAGAFVEMRENGGTMVLVDPRLTGFSSLADDWLPVRPGTELAFLLGVAGQLVRTGRYDKEWVAAHANGFEDFAKSVEGYSLEWASEKTGLSKEQIGTVASNLADNAPAAFVDLPWAGTFGCGYKNSVDTVRMVLLINAMLGNTNQPGGMTYGKTPYVADSMLDPSVVKPLDALQSYPVGAEDALLSWGSSAVGAIRGMKSGDIDKAIVIESNPVIDFTGGKRTADALSGLDCLVVCDYVMTDTAQLADYVLPLTSYLERTDTIGTVAARTSVAAVRTPVIDKLHPDTKSIDELFSGLAEACGKGEYFDFSIDDYNGVVAGLMGVSYDGLKQQAVSAIAGSQVADGDVPYYRTKSGKVDFSSPTFEAAGLSAVPAWVEPGSASSANGPRLLIGEQLIHTHSATVDDARLMNVSKDYDLDRAWINDDYAASIGVSDGDEVEISSSEGSVKVRAKVTNCIHPEAVWLPAHYGCTSADEKEANGFGAAAKSIIPLASEPGTGAAMVQEAIVTVKKVGA